MIKPTLEKFVDDFANTENLEDAVQKLKDGLSQTLNTGNKNDSDNEAFVLIGYDTRQSSPHLASLIE
jgi:2,3-bisphosphoglycerate-independent phosphoglycerate mutase